MKNHKIFVLMVAMLMSSLQPIRAQTVPDRITVYSPANAGARIDTCKSVLDVYEKQYNAKITYAFHPGADGVIAMEEMLRDKGFAVLCSGPSESIFNAVLYKDRAQSHAKLTMVTMLAVGASSFYTGPKTSQDDLPALLATKRPLKIGTHSSAQKFIGRAVFGDHAITWVNFGKPMDALPSILDGSIDIYMSSGSYEALVRDGKVKSLGFINGSAEYVQGRDLTSLFPAAARLPLFLALTTSLDQDARMVEEFNRRLQSIIGSDDVRQKYAKMSQKPLQSTVTQANDTVDLFRRLLLDQSK